MEFKVRRLFIGATLSIFSTFAFAGMGQVSGETNCLAVVSLEKKLIIPTACQFEADVGASMSYAIKQIKFTMPNGYVVQTDNSSTFDFDKNGNQINLKSSVTINGEQAEEIIINSRTFSEILESELNQRYEDGNTDFSDVLTCYKPTRKNGGAFCFPFTLLDGYE